MQKARLIPVVDSVSVYALTTPAELPDNVSMIKAEALWEQGFRGQGVKVAILDTGCNPHPDLAGRIVAGRNFTDEGTPEDYRDLHGHGTHVAGIVAANQNGTGIVGVAPEAELLIAKVLNKDGDGYYSWIINGINWAVSQGARIISMSLGGPTPDVVLYGAILNAVESNVLVVCAAGNSGDGNPDTNEYAYPAAFNEVVAVGACDQYADVAYFSNSNTQIDLVAPGVSILSTGKDGGYVSKSGTSMAAPHVSGGAALVINQFERDYRRRITEPELYEQLVLRTAKIRGDVRQTGAGMLRLINGYQPPMLYHVLTDREAIDIIASTSIKPEGGEPIFDSPEFWYNLIAKFEADPVTYADFQYVGLAFRKFAAHIQYHKQ